MQKGKDLEDSGTDIGQRRQATRLGWAQAGRPSPFQGPVTSPFDLAAIRAIYGPGVESHASINSSSAAEEQKRGTPSWKGEGRASLSVRNMVPTITSSKRRGLSLNGRC
jgi:hypothetical protein